jgi:hypothetical protein
LTLSPDPRERRDAVIRPFKTQLLQVFVNLFESTSLLTIFAGLCLEKGCELEGVFVDGAGRPSLGIGWLGHLQAEIASYSVSGDA